MVNFPCNSKIRLSRFSRQFLQTRCNGAANLTMGTLNCLQPTLGREWSISRAFRKSGCLDFRVLRSRRVKIIASIQIKRGAEIMSATRSWSRWQASVRSTSSSQKMTENPQISHNRSKLVRAPSGSATAPASRTTLLNSRLFGLTTTRILPSADATLNFIDNRRKDSAGSPLASL